MYSFSIEDDFITWKDKFWPAVCEYFGIESTGEDINMRQYRLEEYDETPKEYSAVRWPDCTL